MGEKKEVRKRKGRQIWGGGGRACLRQRETEPSRRDQGWPCGMGLASEGLAVPWSHGAPSGDEFGQHPHSLSAGLQRAGEGRCSHTWLRAGGGAERAMQTEEPRCPAPPACRVLRPLPPAAVRRRGGVKPGLARLCLSALASRGRLGVPRRQSVWMCAGTGTRTHGHARTQSWTRAHTDHAYL